MEDDCGAQRAAGWPCSPSEEWVALWAKGIAPALSDATCHSAVRRRPSCSNTVDMLREKLREEEGDVGTPRAGGYGSCRGGTTRRGGGCICTTFGFPQPAHCTPRPGQTISNEGSEQAAFCFGSSCRLAKGPSRLTDKQGKTQRCFLLDSSGRAEQQGGGRPI